jgi:hypothetical protein
MKSWLAAAVIAASLIAAAQAQPRVAFTDQDAAALREYYAPKAEGKGKGKAKGQKEKDLPPGLQKKLARGEPLPPGHAKRVLPADLEKRLGPLPTGYTRYVVGPDVVILDTRRDLVVDIILNIVL